MFTVLFAQCLGHLCARLPESFCQGLCRVLGDALYFLPTQRRYRSLANLHHAFPDKPLQWHRNIARESLRRLVELALWVLTSPYMSAARIQQCLTIPEATRQSYREIEAAAKRSRGGVALIPHLTLFVLFTSLPLVYPETVGFGAIFRPLDNPALNRWVKTTRERWGIRLFSRKAGYRDALATVQQGGWVGVLFDLNAGGRGALIPFCGRIASATPLPGLICKRFQVPAVVMYARRTGFWRAEWFLHKLDCELEPEAVTVASNYWLERYLHSGDDACADWMWSQRRWRSQRNATRRLRLQHKKDYSRVYLQQSGQKCLPQRDRFWVRMPNWLGDVIMTLPLLRALRKGRPDGAFTLLAQPAHLPFLKALGVADGFIPLPDRNHGVLAYYHYFHRLRLAYPDTVLLFTHSLRGDLEAWLTDAPQRLGLCRPGRLRPFLTDAWAMPGKLNEAGLHQTRLWEQYLQHFGLNVALDLEPFAFTVDQSSSSPAFGLICGAENNLTKRWPYGSWRMLIRELLQAYPDHQCLLFGTANDCDVNRAIAGVFPPDRVIDLAGQTDLISLARRLTACRAVIGNDTGGIHLANAIGVPVVGIFGPTNPIRTRPVFTAPVCIVQAPGCPPAGGRPMAGVTPSVVFNQLAMLLAEGDGRCGTNPRAC